MHKELKIENGNLIITIPLKTTRNNPYFKDSSPEMDNIAGYYEDEYNNGLVYVIDMDYKGKGDQHSDYFYKSDCSKEEFDKMIKELKINAIYPEKCAYCKKSIEETCQFTEKGLMCHSCELKDKSIEEEWCKCTEEKDITECFEKSNFVENGLCPCKVWKHHYHGGICGKITQIG